MIRKTRPAVVVSPDVIGILAIKMIALITELQDHDARNIWHIRIDPDRTNGLKKTSAVDALQVRGVSTDRFIRNFGRVSSATMEEIAAVIAAVVEYEKRVHYRRTNFSMTPCLRWYRG